MRKIILLGLLIIFLALISAYEGFRTQDGRLHIYICDVGQGDAIFIRTPDSRDILIDGGPDSSVLSCLSEAMPFWDRQIEALILTHPHADHFTGFIDVLKRYKVNHFYTNGLASETETWKVLQEQLAVNSVSASFLEQGEIFKEESGLNLKIIWPSREFLAEIDQTSSKYDPNATSVSFILDYGNFEVLFSGDAEADTLYSVKSRLLDVEVVKVPHQGSKGAFSDEMLSIISPELAIVSVGERNRYGHPHRETLDFLIKHGVKLLRTDKDGTVKIESDGQEWWLAE